MHRQTSETAPGSPAVHLNQICTPARFLFVPFMAALNLHLSGPYVGVCCEQEHILSVTVSLLEEVSAQVYQCYPCAGNTLKQEMHF